MPRPPLRLPEGEVVRLALTRREAAEALGISLNSFERHVQPEVKVVRRGKLRLIPISALERWLEENAASIVEDLSDRAGSPRLECGRSGRAPGR
jgi:excisionase family DNA binding protein